MEKIPEYQLTRARRRSIAIQITPSGGVQVKAPYLVPKMIIDQFVFSKRNWIEKHLTLVSSRIGKQNEQIKIGKEYLFLGETYPLAVNHEKHITLTKTLNVPEAVMFRLKKELTAWYITQAKIIITERVEYYSSLTHTTYKKITFSDTTSKWGSCSHDNALQFSWRLIMTPLHVIDYVVVHELMHTKEKNHGVKFWSLVEKYKPAYKQHRKWLRNHSYTLHAVV
jgi:predicted metal-dependent hydrolase